MIRRPGRRATVLLLDDDEGIASFVNEALPTRQYDVVWTTTVDKAMQSLQTVRPDIALVDIVLGRESGFDFLRGLRKSADMAKTPVVMLTGSDQVPDRELSLEMGADRYLVKPVAAATLQRVVSELLAARDDIWWTFSLRSHQVDRIRELLFDTTTEIPTLALVVEQLRSRVEAGESLSVYCVELEPLFRTDERNYWDSFDALRREFVRGLHFVLSPFIGRDPVVATSHAGGNDFYLFVAQEKNVQPAQTARELESTLRSMIRDIDADPYVVEEVAIFVGGATTQGQTLYAPRVLYNAVREAKDSAEKRESRYYQGLSERLSRAIRERTIWTVFQPVVNLETGEVIGHEALSRGPKGTEIESPEIIFDLARDLQLVWELETLCIENVRPVLTQVCSRGLLFFNLESHFIQQLESRGTEVLETLLSCDRRVVIEVTERSAIRDYGNFRRTLGQLKRMGFKIAVDDCGSGYATLESVAELHPDYLKVGHSLFQGLENDPVRRRLVDLVARCADSIGAVTIAEAIETEEQLRICRDLNIQHGQGYLFSRPGPWERIAELPSTLRSSSANTGR
jgi:EAL domain-containing protein (putative c-di-GMP-specific phosphodiesterase class I)/DNA-binding response OmpR family regulator